MTLILSTFYLMCMRDFIARRPCLGQWLEKFTKGSGWR